MIFSSPNIHCSNCAATIKNKLQTLSGIQSVDINIPQKRIQIEWQADQITQADILRALADWHYPSLPWQPLKKPQKSPQEKQMLKRIFVAAVGMMQVMTYAVAVYVGIWQDMDAYWKYFFDLFSLVTTTPVLIYSGKPFFQQAWQAIKSRQMHMDIPVALAMAIAFIWSTYNTFTQQGVVYFDSVIMFIFFLLIGRFAEMRARYKTGAATQAMAELLPETTFRLIDQQLTEISLNEIQVNDILVIKPGAAIPADGEVLQGHSQVNEALLTGESLPKSKEPGDHLIAGSVNGSDMLHMRVQQVGDQLFIASLLKLLETAQNKKPKIAQLADKVAGHFILSILVISILVAIAWWFVDASRVLDAVLAVLIVTCPCALSLATPTALVTACGTLARQGLLTVNSDALLTLNRINYIFMDKTGTLTQGLFKIIDCHVMDTHKNKQQCLAIAAALEHHSEHPLAKAFAPYLENDIIATHCHSIPGTGIQGKIENEIYWIGQPYSVANALKIALPDFPTSYASNASWLVLANSRCILAWFELGDPLRTDSQAVIQTLKNRNLPVEMISGDLQITVDAVAKQLNLSHAHGQITPQIKHQLIQEKQSEGFCVAMIGDGVNDAAVLAQANVGIAMGQGTRIAQASADLILLGETLSPLITALDIAKKTKSIMQQNIAWAVGYNIIAIPLAALGYIPAWLAAIGMSVSSLIVVINALRLRIS